MLGFKFGPHFDQLSFVAVGLRTRLGQFGLGRVGSAPQIGEGLFVVPA